MSTRGDNLCNNQGDHLLNQLVEPCQFWLILNIAESITKSGHEPSVEQFFV